MQQLVELSYSKAFSDKGPPTIIERERERAAAKLYREHFKD
jgi:hypothetical protein